MTNSLGNDVWATGTGDEDVPIGALDGTSLYLGANLYTLRDKTGVSLSVTNKGR